MFTTDLVEWNLKLNKSSKINVVKIHWLWFKFPVFKTQDLYFLTFSRKLLSGNCTCYHLGMRTEELSHENGKCFWHGSLPDIFMFFSHNKQPWTHTRIEILGTRNLTLVPQNGVWDIFIDANQHVRTLIFLWELVSQTVLQFSDNENLVLQFSQFSVLCWELLSVVLVLPMETIYV